QRLAEIERDLADSRAERAAVEERAQALDRELAATRAGLAAAEEQFEGLKRTSGAETAQLRAALEARATELKVAAEQHAAQIGELKATSETREAQLQSQLVLAQKDVRGLEGRVTGYLEVLHSLQGQRGVFDSEIAVLDARMHEH